MIGAAAGPPLGEAMTMTKSRSSKWSTIRRPLKAEQQARVDAIKRAMEDAIALNELRGKRGATQVQLAKAIGIQQASLSELERRDDVYLSSLRNYVEGLGGELYIAAVFPDGEQYPIRLERPELAQAEEFVHHSIAEQA
jgi:DNA-binding XRE family transcriptional regulator